MKKHILSLFALLIIVQVAWCASITAPADITNYYKTLDGLAGEKLWTATSSVTNLNYKSIGYKGLYTAYKQTDVYPAGHPQAGKIWDMYGECAFATGNTCGNYNGVCDCYNREHSIPQSWWGGGTSGIGNDIFHVLPTDGKINGVRSNYEYGEVNGGTNWNGNHFGSADSWSTDRKTIASAAGESVKGSGQVFEPKEEYKGDIARGLLGTIVKWQQSNLTSGNNFFNGKYTASSYYGLTKKAVVLLVKWHREDPVSQKEIDRNNGIQATQGNRNPFIDYPYLVEYIWGEHAGETIDMSKLMPSTDPEFIPGVSNGSREGSTPVVPPQPANETYTISWMANGTEIGTTEVEENMKPNSLPDEPVSCSSESDHFMGWTDEPIEGTSDYAPAVLYTKLTDIPAVTEDLTLYAVFAHADAEGASTPATYTFNADHQDGWSNTANKTGSYWLLDQGKTLTSPEVNLAGLQSIVVTMRTYGGTQFDQLAVKAGSTTITTFEASKGSTMTAYTWENKMTLSGTSALVFSSPNAGSKKGIGFQEVVINASGSTISYERYITSCQSGSEVVTGVDDVRTNAAARKILVGNRIYIIIGDQLFTVQGERVK